jgi:hypothetical protein
MAKASIAATTHPIGIALMAGRLKAIIKIRASSIGQDAISAPIPNGSVILIISWLHCTSSLGIEN